MEELIIVVAPHPSEKQEEKFPGKMDVADELIRCYSAGASVGHLHVRDEDGIQVIDTTYFKRDIDRTHAACPMIIEGSTGGTPDNTLEERCVSLTVEGVEMGSLNMGSINLFGGVYGNPYHEIRYYAETFREKGIIPSIACFDLSHFTNVRRLIAEGLLSPPYPFDFVFDIPDSLPYSDTYLDYFLDEMPEDDHTWIIVRHHAEVPGGFMKALENGGHVRVGFEDGPFLSNGRRACSNAELVDEMVKMAESVGRKVVDAHRAREILGIKPWKMI